MSFIQRGPSYGGLIRDSYPNAIARNRQEVTEHEGLPSYLVMPNTKDELFEWAKVVGATTRDYTRRHELVYKKSKSGSLMASRVSLRLYGFLGVQSFHPYGNWDGEEHSAMKAVTFLKLEPGCFPEQHNEQLQAIEDLKLMIYKSLPGYRPTKRVEKPDLFFQRRVFRKVESPSSKSHAYLTNAVDMDAKAQNMAKRWVADQGIDFGRKSDTARIVHCDPLIFNEGDFVDVHVTFDIVTGGRGPQKTVAIHMSPSQVIRLARADVFTRSTVQQNPSAPSSPAVIVVSEDKLVFDEQDEVAEHESSS